MGKTKVTFRFEVRRDKVSQVGFARIFLIVSIKGQRRRFDTGIAIDPIYWNTMLNEPLFVSPAAVKKQGHIPIYKEDYTKIEGKLNAVKKSAYDIVELYTLQMVEFTSQDVVNKLKDHYKPLTKKEAKRDEVFIFMQHYIDENKNTRVAGSLAVYKSVMKHLTNYGKASKKHITFADIDYGFFASFQNYLITVPKLSNTTIAKQLSTVKTFLNYAKKYGYEISDKYKQFEIKRENLEVIALTQDEFDSLFNLDLSDNKKLQQIRDVFIFSCATGLRFSDLRQLKREHIFEDVIKLNIKKIKLNLEIPLNGYSKFILHTYKQSAPNPLPVISNQKSNEYLHELCKKAKINTLIQIVRFRGAERIETTYPKHELITMHSGRKTFATLSLEKGMTAEEVMAIGGWKDYKSFKRYVNVTGQRKKTVMLKAWGNVVLKKNA